MKINFKINNQTFIFILIVIILFSLLFSCSDSSVDNKEGLTNICNPPPYGNNSDGTWYDMSCSSSTNHSFAILPHTAINTDISTIPCSDISDASFNEIFQNNPKYNAYYYSSDNSINLFGINTTTETPTIIWNCAGTSDQITIPGFDQPVPLNFYNGNIMNSVARSCNIYKYPDDFQTTPEATNNDSQNQNNGNLNGQVSNQVTQSQNAVNVNVDTSNPGTNAGTTNLNNVNNVPAIAFPPSVNSVITPVQPSFMQNVENGFNSLFGNGGSNSTLLMNNISDINGDTNTPSTLFTTQDGRQGIATPDNTINGIPSSQIPQGQEDLYILKSQVVPPVCPACPPVIVDKNTLNQDCPPCPPCARCPEPSFDCKKVPNYSLGPENTFLPRPVLNDFSTFGM